MDLHGSGKGTVAKNIANKYGLLNIDTGAMYRCIALKALNENVKLEEKEKLVQISKNIRIELKADGTVLLDGTDVTKEIRSKEVSSIVSQISSIKEIRLNMVEMQRKMASRKKSYNGRKRYNNICISARRC